MSDEEYEIIFVPNEGRAILDKKTKKIYYSEFQIIEEKNEQLDKYEEILDKIKEYIKNLLKEEFEITDPDNIYYGQKCQRAYFSDSELIKILELLEEIE